MQIFLAEALPRLMITMLLRLGVHIHRAKADGKACQGLALADVLRLAFLFG